MRNESILKKEGSYILNNGVQIPAVDLVHIRLRKEEMPM